MGCFNTIRVPCPKCQEPYEAQSKGGDCSLSTFNLEDASIDDLSDINRHAPFTCEKCGAAFKVKVVAIATSILYQPPVDDDAEWHRH